MSFKSNDSQQITLNDALFGLTDREKRMLEKSWAKPFAEKIFLKIDESRFACLYSDKASRPNTPVNVCAGALIIKELLNLTLMSGFSMHSIQQVLKNSRFPIKR